jgi:hypothetical protein
MKGGTLQYESSSQSLMANDLDFFCSFPREERPAR